MKKRDLSPLSSPEMGELERKGNALALEASLEGAVLLENNGALPLVPGKVALFGHGARHTIVSGIGSGDIMLRYTVTIEEGLKNHGFTITSAGWLDAFDDIYARYRTQLLQEGEKESEATGIDLMHVIYAKPHIMSPAQPITQEDMDAAVCDTAIYVLSRQEGEGIDNRYLKGEYLPMDEELAHLRALRNCFKKLVVLLNTGAPIELREVLAIGPDAVMQVFQGGAEIGNAVAKLFVGERTPSGKVTCTWAKDYWDYPNSRIFGMNDGNPELKLYKEGVYTGYRYFDTFGVEPQYPFGYGLSYTTFAIENRGIRRDGSKITVMAQVQNTGSYPGKEVLQLYVTLPSHKQDNPRRQLCAFTKTELLAPGECQSVSLSFCMEDIAGFSTPDAAYLLEAGDYVLWLGTSVQDNSICGLVRLTGERVTRRVRHLFERPVLFEEMTAPAHAVHPVEHAQRQAAPVCTIAPQDIPADGQVVYSDQQVNLFGGKIDPEKVNKGNGESIYLHVPDMISLAQVKSGEYTLDEMIASMDAEELIALVVGQYNIDPRFKIKHTSTHVLGAAGETTNYFVRHRPERGIPYTVTADGPAGLRLVPHVQAREDGEIVFVNPLLAYAGGEYVLDDPGYVKDAEDYYQYVTALPISIQLASTWNVQLLYRVGNHIGAEMERYDVDLLLAPGLNLNRNPLCGRNYEYYSEDPFVSAAVSIAVTNGVQSRPGRGATIKHLAANNQETSRTSHMSVVSERTMRELYLKGFELTTKYAHPSAMMTSLNCVNGPHGTNSKDIATYVVRDEWHYDGVIMTDWNTTTPARGGSTTGCINAGNDLIMPGSEDDIKKLYNALHNLSGHGDTVTLGALQASAKNVLHYILRTSRV